MPPAALATVSRLCLLGYALVLGQGVHAIADPLAYAARLGFELNAPISATYIRIGYGAMPCSLALAALVAIFQPRCQRAVFGIALLNCVCVIAVRLAGIALEGGDRQFTLLALESSVLIALVAGLCASVARERGLAREAH